MTTEFRVEKRYQNDLDFPSCITEMSPRPGFFFVPFKDNNCHISQHLPTKSKEVPDSRHSVSEHAPMLNGLDMRLPLKCAQTVHVTNLSKCLCNRGFVAFEIKHFLPKLFQLFLHM